MASYGDLVGGGAGAIPAAGTTGYVAYYTAAGTIGGVAGLTFDGTGTLTVTVKYVGPVGTNAAVAFSCGNAGTGMYSNTSTNVALAAGATPVLIGASTGVLTTANAAFQLGGISGNGPSIQWDTDNFALGQRNGVNPTQFRVYNTFTSSTNYERLAIDWVTSANVCRIDSQKGASGTARPVALAYAGTERMRWIGFFGATPVAQGASIADASGGAIIDAEARTALNALISRIEATGLIATV